MGKRDLYGNKSTTHQGKVKNKKKDRETAYPIKIKGKFAP